MYCYDKVSEPPVRHRMAYIGHEPERGTLKYRCPAKHEGWTCPMSDICNAGKSYGKTVRVKQEDDLRRFPPIPRATKQFERLYKGRTAVERVNARLKIFWGADDGNLVGAPRFHGFLGTILVVHVALATVLASLPRREGTLGRMNALSHRCCLAERMRYGPARPGDVATPPRSLPVAFAASALRHLALTLRRPRHLCDQSSAQQASNCQSAKTVTPAGRHSWSAVYLQPFPPGARHLHPNAEIGRLFSRRQLASGHSLEAPYPRGGTDL